MSGNKRKISSGSEISFSELKHLAEDGDAIAQNKLAFNRYKHFFISTSDYTVFFLTL